MARAAARSSYHVVAPHRMLWSGWRGQSSWLAMRCRRGSYWGDQQREGEGRSSTARGLAPDERNGRGCVLPRNAASAGPQARAGSARVDLIRPRPPVPELLPSRAERLAEEELPAPAAVQRPDPRPPASPPRWSGLCGTPPTWFLVREQHQHDRSRKPALYGRRPKAQLAVRDPVDQHAAGHRALLVLDIIREAIDQTAKGGLGLALEQHKPPWATRLR